MATDVLVNVKIDGLSQSASGVKDLTNAINGLAAPTQKMQKGLKDTTDSLTDLSTKGFAKFKSVALGALAAVGLSFAGREMIKAAEEKQVSINSLNITLASLGIYSKKTSEEMIKFADTMEQTTKFSDDQVISTINLLGAMTTLDKEGLKKATKGAMDLSSTMGIDLETATRAIGKSIEGNVGGLKKFSVVVKAGANESQNLANTMQAMSRMAGRSEKDINTFSGAMTFLKNGFDQVLTAMGNMIVSDPMITKFIKTVGQGFFSLSDAISGFKITLTDSLIYILEQLAKFGITFQTIVQAVQALIGTVLIVAFVALGFIIKAFVVEASIFLTEFGVLANVVGVKVAVGLNLMAVAASASALAMKVFWGALSAGGLLILGELIFLIVQAKDELGGWGNLFASVGINIQIAIVKMQKAFYGLRETLNDVVTSMGDKFGVVINYMRDLKGLPPIEFKTKTRDLSAASEKTIQLTKDIADLEAKIADMKTTAKKGGTTDMFASSLDSLKTLKAEFAKAKTDFQNNKAGSAGGGAIIDTKKIVSDYEALSKELAGLDQGELGRLQAVYDQKSKVISDYNAMNGSNHAAAGQAMHELDVQFAQQKTDLDKKQMEEAAKLRQDQVNQAKTNPMATLAGLDKDITKQIKYVITPKVQGLVEGFGEGIKKGGAGATDMMTGLVAGGIDAMMPGVGGALKPFIDMFAQGPEATKKMMTEFMQMIPTFITNVISAVPAFIQTIVRETPKMIQALVTQLPIVIKEFANSIPVIIDEFIASIPVIINSIVESIPTIISALVGMMPTIALSLAEAFVFQIPFMTMKMAESAAGALFDAVSSIFEALNPFGGGGGGFFESINPFAEGGKIVKGGIAGQDSVPAALMPGEIVVDRGLTNQMQKFFDTQGQSGNSDVTNALLSKVISLLSSPQEINTSVRLNNKTLADIMINLNRTNSRVIV